MLNRRHTIDNEVPLTVEHVNTSVKEKNANTTEN